MNIVKKILLAATTASVMSSAVLAANDGGRFYDNSVGIWSVVGLYANSENGTNPACVASTSWQDGSYFNLIQDLADGELLIEFTNNDWNVTGPYGEGLLDMTMNFYGNNRVDSRQVKFKMMDKNTIVIHGIDHNTFLPLFMNYSKVVMIMPGDVQNSELTLKDSTRALNLLTQCLKQSEKENLSAPANNTGGGMQQGI